MLGYVRWGSIELKLPSLGAKTALPRHCHALAAFRPPLLALPPSAAPAPGTAAPAPGNSAKRGTTWPADPGWGGGVGANSWIPGVRKEVALPGSPVAGSGDQSSPDPLGAISNMPITVTITTSTTFTTVTPDPEASSARCRSPCPRRPSSTSRSAPRCPWTSCASPCRFI